MQRHKKEVFTSFFIILFLSNNDNKYVNILLQKTSYKKINLVNNSSEVKLSLFSN
jgi:hypothetical protein